MDFVVAFVVVPQGLVAAAAAVVEPTFSRSLGLRSIPKCHGRDIHPVVVVVPLDFVEVVMVVPLVVPLVVPQGFAPIVAVQVPQVALAPAAGS